MSAPCGLPVTAPASCARLGVHARGSRRWYATQRCATGPWTWQPSGHQLLTTVELAIVDGGGNGHRTTRSRSPTAPLPASRCRARRPAPCAGCGPSVPRRPSPPRSTRAWSACPGGRSLGMAPSSFSSSGASTRLKFTPATTAVEFRDNHDAPARLQREHLDLKHHFSGLEDRVRTYAHLINELTLENQVLREQVARSITYRDPLHPRTEA